MLLVAHVGLLPFGHLLGGILAENIGPRTTTLIMAAALTLIGIITLWKRVPEIDDYPSRARRIKLKNFFSEMILASSHRADALALDQSTNKP
jgi:hypothetical protein